MATDRGEVVDDTLTRAEEEALTRARRTVAREGTRRSRSRSVGKRPNGRRRRPTRSATLDLARGVALTITVTLLLAGDLGTLPGMLRPAGGDGFGVADLLPVTLTVLVGVSMAWQLANHRREPGRWWALRWVRRVVTLVAVAALLAWLRAPDPAAMRLTGPLVRLAVGGLLAWLVATRLSPRVQAALGAVLVLGHWFLLGRGVLGAGGAAARLEAELLHGRVVGPVDPDGLTALGPTVVAVLAGVWIGRWLRNRPAGPATVVAFGLAGLYGVAAALVVAQVLPVNATLWTGTTLLLGAGIVLVLLALAHLAVEVLPGRRPTRWVGAVGAEALPVYALGVALATALARTPLRHPWHALRSSLVEPLVGADLATLTLALAGTAVLARVAVALVDRGTLLRA